MKKNITSIKPDLKKQLKDIPSSSGIYMMLDKKGDVIYIGKALNLKSRIRSYFNITSWRDRPKLNFMMPKVCEVKTVITRSEQEALILEANLVNKHQPKYNVTLKDDKKFPWLMITYDESYPRVVPVRDVAGFKAKFPKTKNKFFGPYSDSGAMWETYKIIKEGFQLRLRRKPLFKDRPCMNYHLKLCSGPCQNLISDSDYQKIVKQAEDFLLGKYNVVLKDLKNQMKTVSRNLEYEKAAKIRDTVKKIEKVLEKQIVVSNNPKLSQDVFACSFQDLNMVLELMLIREGKIIAVEPMVINVPKDSEPEYAFSEAVKQYYARVNDKNIPKEIIVQYKLQDEDYVQDWLSLKFNQKILITTPQKGRKLELIKMAEQNAKLSLQQVLIEAIHELSLHELPLQELQRELNLKNYPHHIECFDISHLGGTGTVGSMVSFIDGKPNKNEYRKFKLKTVLNKIDDFQSMREIVTRRYSNQNVPDLIIIDGGKGQLNAAKEALEGLGIDLDEIDLISLAKRLEEVFKPNEKKSILLDRKSQVLFLLQRIRDEAHRFAITYQRERRKKDLFEIWQK
ncbi:MAG: excinuclease ABC subunit C [Candidatus Melainabacteria bacterium RIFCSPLOWO2_02_FULL_35_15]|nr:MAG: excinuclease ABC subunit C [Candidatus Melainabacteria bacterium RIFCSPLOWO2_12_FULL_35_11]OGI12820.1 MAG: excinuclease ABC subunit C [Candidatus Melainabacteria bacterium RIFCSPLOWO2_02_FULL_35_15]